MKHSMPVHWSCLEMAYTSESEYPFLLDGGQGANPCGDKDLIGKCASFHMNRVCLYADKKTCIPLVFETAHLGCIPTPQKHDYLLND